MKIKATNNRSRKRLSTKDTIKIGMYSDASVGKQFLFISGARLVISVNNFGDTS